MSDYEIKFDKVTLNNNDIEISNTTLFEIFEELIDGKCKFIYLDDLEYGFTLLFKQLEKNKEEYIKSTKNIESSTKEELDTFLEDQNEKKLKDLL
jgi:hypothetical protein